MYHKQRTTKAYSITSPYTELLESKKKVYGLKYHSSFGGNASHSKSTQNQNTSGIQSSSVKGRPASSSLASHHNKSGMKSNSSQKVKSTKSQNPKKKRIYTEQAQNFNEISSDPKMHQSLFVNMDHKNTINQLASKSLFPNQLIMKNNYINNYDFLKKFSQFNAQLKDKQQQHVNFSGSKSQKSNKSTKSRGKTGNKLPQNTHNRSINFETINVGKSIEQMGLTEVEDLICLIDNCVEQANEYISFLAGKVQSLKNQLMKCKAEEFELERIIKVNVNQCKEKNKELENKNTVIGKLKNQIQLLRTQKSSFNASISANSPTVDDDFKSKEVKKILQVLNQMNERNQFLQSKVKGLEGELSSQRKQKEKLLSQDRDYVEEEWVNANSDFSSKMKEKRKSSNSKDIYNEIHSKIDILNISIDNNKKSTQNSSNYAFTAQNQRSEPKKYKFIKPKNK